MRTRVAAITSTFHRAAIALERQQRQIAFDFEAQGGEQVIVGNLDDDRADQVLIGGAVTGTRGN